MANESLTSLSYIQLYVLKTAALQKKLATCWDEALI